MGCGTHPEPDAFPQHDCSPSRCTAIGLSETRAALRGEPSGRQAVDGVFLAQADSQDVARSFVDLAIDETEPLRPLAGHVELHPGKPSEVTADVPVTEQFADHSPVGEIIEDRLRRVECGWVDRIERRKVGGDVQSEGERVWGK